MMKAGAWHLLAAISLLFGRHGVTGEDDTLSASPIRGAQGEGSSCILYQTSPWGFCSKLNGLLMTSALYNTTSDIYLDGSAWAFKCSNERGSWHDFFAGPLPRNLLDALNPAECEVLPYEGCLRCGHNVLSNTSAAETFPMLGEAAKQLWQLSSSMQRLADIQTAYLASLPKPLVAIHIRGGDKAHEDREAGRNPEWYKEADWVRTLQELLRKNGLQMQEGGGTCLMYGDDLHAMHLAAVPLLSKVDCATIMFGGSLGGHHQAAMDANMTRAAACRSTRDIVLALHALSSADVFIGNYNSNVARFCPLAARPDVRQGRVELRRHV